MKDFQTKANFRFTLLLILIFAVTNNLKSQSFITEWHFPTATNQLSFNAITTDTVNYHWLAKPSGNTGSGQISSGAVTIPINVLANDSLTLTLTHANLRSFTINNGPNKENLVNVKQWGDAPWNYLEYAFAGCSKLQISALDTPDLSNVVSLFSMFFQATSFNSPVEHWNTSNITNMRSVFNNAQSFNQPIGKWNTSNVTTMTRMFLSAISFNKPLNNWNTGNVTDMSLMFSGATNFNDSIGNWNTINVTNMSSMFSGATSFNKPIGSWNTTNVTNMSSMFSSATNYNQPIGVWNTTNVTNMSSMFSGATNFNQPIGSWNTGNVTDMSSMFSGAANFNQPIGSWTTDNVTNMNGKFFSATNFNQPIGDWNTENVSDMSSMFSGAISFNQPIGDWNTSKVTNMSFMFNNADVFNQIISTWDVSKVTFMSFMFSSANLYNQPLNGWNTSLLVDAQNMFKNALAFNQNLGNWNLSSITNLTEMLSTCGITCEKYDSTLIGWANNALTPNNLVLGALGKKYGFSLTHRNYLVNTKNWQIIGDAFSLNCNDTVVSNSDKEFITQWYFPEGTNSVFFNIYGTGPVAYSWTTKPSNNSGVGVINVPANQIPMILNQNDSVTIRFSPQNLRSFTIDNGPNKANLIDIKQWGGAPWENMENMFSGCENLQITALDTPKLNNVLSLAGLFRNATKFNSPINHWDVSNITNLSGLFSGTINFNQPLSNWNTENVIDMSLLFSGASNFNQPIGSWNTTKVKDMWKLFFNCFAFNQPINDWNTSNVTDMGLLFYGASSFNQPLDNWNTSNVEYMYEMFRQASNFNQPIGVWETSNVKYMFRMFFSATSFNQPIGKWNTSNVELMYSTFSNATSFNQSLNEWNLSKVTLISNMFTNSGLSCEKYDSTLIGWYHNPATPNNLNLGAMGVKYWLSKHYRSKLITEKGWIIQGDINDQCNYTIPCTEITWVGNTGNWNNPDNWNYSITPIPCHDVLVKNPTDIIQVPSSVNAEIKSLNNKGVINLQNGAILKIKD